MTGIGHSYQELIGEISVCEDCTMQHANGVHDPDRPADLPAVWSEIGFGYLATMGGDHADGCPNGPDGSRDTDCDCGDYGFRTTDCEACGDWHHGDRYKFTLWRFSREEALLRYRREIKRAASFRADGNAMETGRAVASMALYRRYLLDLHAANRRFAAWRESVNA